MKTLDEHNEFRSEIIKRLEKPRNLAGVLCPKCNEEMIYIDIMMLIKNHPKVPVKCPKCGYEGYMI